MIADRERMHDLDARDHLAREKLIRDLLHENRDLRAEVQRQRGAHICAVCAVLLLAGAAEATA